MKVDAGLGTAKEWRARLARLLLFGGLAGAVAVILPALPREQILSFRLEERELVEELRATWSVEGREQPEGGVTLHFSGSPPRTVRHTVSLPNGPYVLDISVRHADDPRSGQTHAKATDSVAGEAPSRVGSELRREPATTTYVRRVNLEGGETIIRL
jgi:hypothetical protein